jgi:mannose-6-phosphate isomerase-like protein (cupin superfamily)
MEVKKVSKKDAKVFLEGPEVCREYLKTGKLTFGTSCLMPGQRGAIDTGHADSHEVFFVSRGHVLMYIEEKNEYHELEEEDIILMPEGVSHTLINIGETPALITWSLAPSE